MPDGRKARGITARRAIRALRRFGYGLNRTSGGHYILEHPEKGILVIPYHRGEVKPEILLDAVKKADIPWGEFVREL